MPLDESLHDRVELLNPNTKVALETLRERAAALGLRHLEEDYAQRLGEGTHHVADTPPEDREEAAKQRAEEMLLGGINTALMTWFIPDRPAGINGELLESDPTDPRVTKALVGNVLGLLGADREKPLGQEAVEFTTNGGQVLTAETVAYEANIPTNPAETIVHVTEAVNNAGYSIVRVDLV